MYGNGAGASGTALGSKATPFFGRYQEHYGQIRSNWQVYTGYTGGYDAAATRRFPPAAPIKISAGYTNDIHIGAIYNGTITVTLYNYAEYRAKAYIQLLAGSSVKYESDDLTAGAMTVNSSKLDPGTCIFSIELSNDSAVRSITSIKVYWYSQNGSVLTSYAYPVSFTIGGGSVGCGCTALITATGTCTCAARANRMDACICGGNAGSTVITCSCGGEHSKMTVCSSSSTQITVSPT